MINTTSLLKEYIINNSDNEQFISIIGENGTGKTIFIKDIKDSLEKINVKVLYLSSELLITDQINEEHQINDSFANQVANYINSLYEHVECKINPKENIQVLTKLIDNCFSNEKSEEDIYFKNELRKIFHIPLQNKNDNISKSKDFYSSGEGFYSLLKMTKYVLSNLKERHDKIYFILDEPEKFLHPTLIKKVVRILFDMFINFDINIIYTTHSPIFLEFTIEQSYRSQKIVDIYKFNKDLQNIKKISLIENINSAKLNSREIKNICYSSFSENIFLVEGLKDYEFVSIFINNEFPEEYYHIIDCGGKLLVRKISKVIENILKLNQCFSFFDRDNVPNKREIENLMGYRNVSYDMAKIKIENTKDQYSNKFKNNFKYFYEFNNDLEFEIEDPNRDKSDLSFINITNIRNMPNFHKIKEKLKIYFERNHNK